MPLLCLYSLLLWKLQHFISFLILHASFPLGVCHILYGGLAHVYHIMFNHSTLYGHILYIYLLKRDGISFLIANNSLYFPNFFRFAQFPSCIHYFSSPFLSFIFYLIISSFFAKYCREDFQKYVLYLGICSLSWRYKIKSVLFNTCTCTHTYTTHTQYTTLYQV